MAELNPNTTTMMDAKTGKAPENIVEGIETGVKQGSAFMKLAKAVPMKKPTEKFTFLSGVGAYWVGEGKRIETSKPTFVTAELVAKKLAVIIPTTRENLQYSVTDFFELMKNEITEAFYSKFDQAGFCGIDSPFLFSVLKSATAAGHITAETANKYSDISTAMGFIEAKDYEANGVAAPRSQKQKYRNTLDANKRPIFNDGTGGSPDSVASLPLSYVKKSAFAGSSVTELVGDWDKAYYGILQGIEFSILTEATLTTFEAEDSKTS